jgi:hypothetical protein
MAEFLTTHATAAWIENIILNSKERLVLVSPYLQLSRTFFDRLKEADERGVKTVVVYGKDELKPEETNQLGKLKNLSLLFCENVHAKCYLNEDNMVITSMNMYEFSEKNNREMGVLVSSINDTNVYKDALREVQSIVKTSIQKNNSIQSQKSESIVVHKIPNTTKWYDMPTFKRIMDTLSTKLTGEKLDGYCIRCGDRIPFDDYHPLCDDCYDKWSEYGNPGYSEHYCHSCGKSIKTTKARPLCSSCYSIVKK